MLLHVRLSHLGVCSPVHGHLGCFYFGLQLHVYMSMFVAGYMYIAVCIYVCLYACMHACMCESQVVLFFVTYSVPSFRRHSILLFIVFVLFTVPAVHSDPSFSALLVSPVLSHSLCFLWVCANDMSWFHVRFPNHLWFWASFHFLTGSVFHIIRWHEKCGLLWLCNDMWWVIEKGPSEACLMEYHFYLKAWLTNCLCIWVSGSQFSQVLKWVSFRENNWRVLLMLEFELSKDNYNPGKHISAIITLTASLL